MRDDEREEEAINKGQGCLRSSAIADLFDFPATSTPRHFCFPLQPQNGLVSSPSNLDLKGAPSGSARISFFFFFLSVVSGNGCSLKRRHRF